MASAMNTPPTKKSPPAVAAMIPNNASRPVSWLLCVFMRGILPDSALPVNLFLNFARQKTTFRLQYGEATSRIPGMAVGIIIMAVMFVVYGWWVVWVIRWLWKRGRGR